MDQSLQDNLKLILYAVLAIREDRKRLQGWEFGLRSLMKYPNLDGLTIVER